MTGCRIGSIPETFWLRVQVLHRAEAIFAGQPEEVTVLRTSCELALSKHDVGAALKRLRTVPRASPLYRAARTAFAEITLRYRKDERQFIAAHVDIVTTFKDYDAHVAAGDAFLSIQVLDLYSRPSALRHGSGTVTQKSAYA